MTAFREQDDTATVANRSDYLTEYFGDDHTRFDTVREAICDELNCSPTHDPVVGRTCGHLAEAALAVAGIGRLVATSGALAASATSEPTDRSTSGRGSP